MSKLKRISFAPACNTTLVSPPTVFFGLCVGSLELQLRDVSGVRFVGLSDLRAEVLTL